MNNLIFKNPAIGEIDLITDDSVRLEEITGVSSTSSVNTQTITGHDGSTVSSVIVPERQILVRFRVRSCADAERTMHNLYRIFGVKTSGTMKFVGRLGSSAIDYVVQSCDIPPNKMPLRGVLTLICPDPYFHEVEESMGVIAGSVSMFKFPYHFPNTSFYISKRLTSVFANVENSGEAETGCTITLYANAEVVNPALINMRTLEAARINITMNGGDTIKITTEKDNKKVTLIRSGREYNILNNIVFPFTFFQLAQGDNWFKYEADSGAQSLDILIEYKAKYAAMYSHVNEVT